MAYYLNPADAHTLRSHESLGAAFGVLYATFDAAADAQAGFDDSDDYEIVEVDGFDDLPDDVASAVMAMEELA